MITPLANERLAYLLALPQFQQQPPEVQHHFDGGCSLTFYTPDSAEHRCCFEIYPDGTVSDVLVNWALFKLNEVINLPVEPTAFDRFWANATAVTNS